MPRYHWHGSVIGSDSCFSFGATWSRPESWPQQSTRLHVLRLKYLESYASSVIFLSLEDLCSLKYYFCSELTSISLYLKYEYNQSHCSTFLKRLQSKRNKLAIDLMMHTPRQQGALCRCADNVTELQQRKKSCPSHFTFLVPQNLYFLVVKNVGVFRHVYLKENIQ